MAVKRKMPREKRRLRLRFGKPGQEPETLGYTQDISPVGLFVAAYKLDELTNDLWLTVELPDEDVLLHGKVVWKRRVRREIRTIAKSGFGVELTQAPEAWYKFFMQSGYAMA
jgi:PilZ domain-containing protein